MFRFFIVSAAFGVILSGCRVPSVKIGSAEREIVLINIEQGDRSFIGEVLLKLDSLNPAVIGVDVMFKGRKIQDSVLIEAFKIIKNDILVYNARPDGSLIGSDSAFTNHVLEMGNLYFEEEFGLVTTMVPLQKIKGTVHELFALKIIKHWQPDFRTSIRVDEKIDINYTRTLDKFHVISGSLLLSTNIQDFELANKVFLVGYVGPGDEDKYFTPLRLVGDSLKRNEPDTYGLVIIANQIRTIWNIISRQPR